MDEVSWWRLRCLSYEKHVISIGSSATAQGLRNRHTGSMENDVEGVDKPSFSRIG